jgi:sugar fermentation stimulation protein A
LLLVEHDGSLVSVDSRLPNRLLPEALMAGRLPAFPEVSTLRGEVRRGNSRLDFVLETTDGPPMWIEAKSVTLVEEGLALFPDAPTARGRRHLIELQDAINAGDRAAEVFVVQRADACAFSPHPTADPDFRAALQEACRHGVTVHAVACQVGLRSIDVSHPLAVLLPD